jgi:hypothetical protein
VQVEFSYEIADLRESQVPEAFAAKPEKYARRWIRTVVIWMIAAVFGAIDVWLNRMFPTPSPSQPRMVAYDFRLEFLPAILVAMYIISVYILTIRATWRGLRKGERIKGWNADPVARVFHILVSVAVGVVAGAAIYGQWDSGAQLSPGLVVTLTLCPWVVLIVLMQVLGLLQRRAKLVGEWRLNPGWRRPKSARLDDHGFVLRDALYELSFTWAYFARARETKNLLILVSESGAEYLIPKRAFADPSDLERCRSLLQNVVPNTRFLVRPIGFAVLPNPVLPLPGIPPQASPTPTLTQPQKAGTMQPANETELQQ